MIQPALVKSETSVSMLYAAYYVKVRMVRNKTNLPVNLSTHQLINSSTHQLINSSTHQLVY